MLKRHCLAYATFYLFVVTNLIRAHAITEQSLADTDLTSLEEKYNNTGKSYYSNKLLTSSEYNEDLDVTSNMERLNGLEEENKWDVLIFTQSWPVTACLELREQTETLECLLPTAKEFWTVHGIWPTKFGEIGPCFCNKTANFDVNQLVAIEDDLKLYWPEINKDARFDWLWEHEWLKHGTCSAILEELDNELKYFSQGLFWRNSYLISNMLGSSGIHPDSNNTVVALQTALVKSLGKNPFIRCIYDNQNDLSYLSEIRICFDKQLQLTDCDGVVGDATSIDYPGGTMLTDCQISKLVHYPSIMPSEQRNEESTWKFPVVNVYKLLQFIMWGTL